MKNLADGPIKRREVLYSRRDGIFRLLNWARVTTSQGTMYEPFLMGDLGVQGDIQDIDPSDPMVRVDDFVNHDPLSEEVIISEGGQKLIGGDVVPRTFKRTGHFVE